MMKSVNLFLFAVLVSLIGGWCLHIMWEWFIVPLGVRGIGSLHATGLLYLLALLRGPEEELPTFDSVVYTLVATLVATLFGYVIHLVM